MNEDFGKWLKRLIKKANNPIVKACRKDFALALGEWALEQYLKTRKEFFSKTDCWDDEKLHNLSGQGRVLDKIAVACLGRKEVEKRLKEKSK